MHPEIRKPILAKAPSFPPSAPATLSNLSWHSSVWSWASPPPLMDLLDTTVSSSAAYPCPYRLIVVVSHPKTLSGDNGVRSDALIFFETMHDLESLPPSFSQANFHPTKRCHSYRKWCPAFLRVRWTCSSKTPATPIFELRFEIDSDLVVPRSLSKLQAPWIDGLPFFL